MSSAGRRTSEAPIGGRGSGSARYLTGQTVQGLLIAAISGGLFWLAILLALTLSDFLSRGWLPVYR